MDKKILRISSKRQITIPQKFFKALGFNDMAECILRDGELVIHPARVNAEGKLAENIIKELAAEGFSSEEFLAEFKVKYKKENYL